MKLKSTLLFCLMVGVWSTISAQLNQSACIRNAVISASSGQSPLYFCKGDGALDVIRFRVSPFAQPFAYLITDENNRLIQITYNNNIDFEGLPAINLRVWAVAYKNRITARVGDIITTTQLADYCYALTTNFISVRGVVPDGGTVSTKGGLSSLFTCAEDGRADRINFSTTSTDPLYRFVVTDENDVIIGFADDGTFNFETLEAETARVYGISYVGSVLAKIGDNINDVQFSSSCFDLSDNFVEILRSQPKGGTVSLSNGETSKTLCAEQLQNDMLTFVSNNIAPTAYAFIITNDNGIVLEVLSGNTATLSISDPGVCRAYGVSFTGNLRVKAGDNINTTAISDDCFDLSTNFVRLIKREVNGGNVRLANSGATASIVCIAPGVSSSLAFTNTSTSTSSSYAYFVTDENNTILAVSNTPSFDFTNFNVRTVRVWGLSYSGNLLAKPGDNAATAALSNECYDLSDNFVTITRQSVNGATVTLLSGATTGVTCTGDGRADIFAFRNTATSTESYIYIITNTSGIVIGLVTGNQFDFNNLTVDSARVYGLSYSGELRVKVGDNINAGNLAGNCFDLSDNFVSITRTPVDGGAVSLTGGAISAQVCLGSAAGSLLSFTNNSTATINYGYFITDNSNAILATASGNSFNFSALTGNAFRVYGFSYSGNITAQVGNNATQIALSNACYELSSNFITVTTDATDGATVSLAGGATTALNCLGDATTQSFTLQNTSTAANDTYYYIVTNESNIVVAINANSAFNLEQLPVGTYRVYGASITDSLTLAVGNNATNTAISNGCFDLSDNFVIITQSAVDGGAVSLTGGATSAQVCLGSAAGSVLSFANNSTATINYGYFITDNSNAILATASGNSFNFSALTGNAFRAYGFSYSGNITAQVGNNATQIALSNACYELSSNFITITTDAVDGGTVSLAGGTTTTFSCLGDALTQTATLQNTSTAANDNYQYIITDTNNITIAIQPDNSISLEQYPAGVYRVYGASVTGTLSNQIVGNNATTFALSNQCFDLSNNFVTITRTAVDGGTVSLANGGSSATVCLLGEATGTLQFVNTSTVTSPYLYLITDTNNILVQSFNFSDGFNFARLPKGDYRVWGLSFNGTLSIPGINPRLEDVKSNTCYDLSSNFITITTDAVDGGNVSLTGGAATALNCLGDATVQSFTLQNTSTTANDTYYYIVTNESNIVVAINANSTFNLEQLAAGTYRVYGASITGTLTLAVGANVTTTPISNACFDLSDNFVTITQSLVDGGTVTSATGNDSVQVCLGNLAADTASFANTSTATASYGYVVTTTNNSIVQVYAGGNPLNFSILTGGTYRVWGFSYTGLGTGTPPNGVNVFSYDFSPTGCFELSSNFVTVITDAADGGRITLTGGSLSGFTCLNDTSRQQLSFVNNSRSENDTYYYVLTNNVGTNRVLAIDTVSSFNLSQFPAGTYRVYGLSITGNLQLTVGAELFGTNISSECYDVSENFVIVTQSNADGGTVRLENDSTAALICTGSDSTALRFENTSTTAENYAYIITNTNNIITLILPRNSFDFAGTTNTNFRVWGVSYSGNITASVGDNITLTNLTNGCYELSSNFVTITRTSVDGGTVSVASGTTVSCLDNGSIQTATLQNNSTAVNDTYQYIITDTNNIATEVQSGAIINLEQYSAGTYRVYGASVTGTLSNQIVGNNITTFTLSDGCYDLSDNFITITRSAVNGGTVRLANNNTSASVCNNSDSTTLRFENTSAAGGNYGYFVTDTNNIIIAIVTDSAYNFVGAANANFRVYGFSYNGTITAQVGANATTTVLTNACYELSSNFIIIIRSSVDGGTVSLTNGDTSEVACLGVAQVGELTFKNTSTVASANYAYLITSEQNIVLAISTNSNYNFSNQPAGTYRVYGVSYTGNLTITAGGNAGQILSDACYELSSNFITVTQKSVNGGTVALANGNTTIAVCGTTSTPGPLTFRFTTDANANYLFIAVDRNNRILVILDGNAVSFNGAAIGEYRVYGLSYTGNVLARIGDNLNTVVFTDECYDLSNNFVRITREATDGGNISTTGDTSLAICPGNSQADVFTLSTTGNSSGRYIYILTDDNNQFISTLTGNSINFDTLPEGTYRLRGLALTGNLTIAAGSNVTQGNLSTQCFDLSENSIRIVNEVPDGGTVAFAEEARRVFTCPGDNLADSITFSASGQAGTNYVFLVTDSNNVVEAILTQGVYDFERATQGVNRVYGLAYNGNPTVNVGDTVTTATLSEDCFDLSNGFIEVIRENPLGGQVTLENGDTSAFVCATGTDPQLLRFDSTGTSNGNYIYVITDSNNVIRNGINGDEFDFSFIQPPGTYRVWGLAYTGNLVATIGDTVTTVVISDACYNLSESFVTVTISTTDGGAITANGSANPISICGGDGRENVIQFSTNAATSPNYSYIITDNNNRFITTALGNIFDFERLSADSARVYGLSYSGNLLLQPGQNIDSVAISSACADLSSNFIRITKSNVDGASIASNLGAGIIYTCTNDGVADVINFASNSTATRAQYRYVLTNENNIIRGVVTGNQFDFETAGRGVSRVYGVSFTGTFTGTFGANITTAALSNACFDLSSNFITVSRDTVFGGEVTAASGETDLIFCPSPDVPGVIISTTSEQFTGYVFVVTDTLNTVITISTSDTVRFDSLPVGNYRVWGLSYAGDLLVQAGDNILGVDLASSCYEISSGFVAIYRSRKIDGGRVVNTNGAQSITVCGSDTIPDFVVLSNTSDSREASYRYVLTDQNNRIIVRSIDNQVIDFNRAGRGTYRIYGISYTGEFRGITNDVVTTAALADSCYQISENFITINVVTPNAGRITLADSTTTTVTRTVGDGQPDIVKFISQGAAGGANYDFVVTDSLNRIIATVSSDSFNFESFPAGSYRVYGLAYDGALTGAVGDTITRVALSDGCFDLTSNFVRVTLGSAFGSGEPENGKTITPNVSIPLEVRLAPNPVVDRMRIQFKLRESDNATTTLTIFNAFGQPLSETRIGTLAGENQHTLDLQSLPDGMYILQIRNGNRVESVRFLRQWQ